MSPIIRHKTLELIAKDIGEMSTGENLVEFLKSCGVADELILYPNTKWKMVCDVLSTLATSSVPNDRRILFTILEEACHPLMQGGDETASKNVVKKFNNLLKYDNLFIDEYGTLFEEIYTEDMSAPEYINKNGHYLEQECYMVFPEDVGKLYVYWNELIKLTKFYFNNKHAQGDEINHIYFEIISTIENLLNDGQCGGLKKTYKKPFKNIIGCEFEVQKQFLTTNGLFANLYEFLGKITDLSLPDKNSIKKTRNDNSKFFIKIQQYIEDHPAKKEKYQEIPPTKIEIVSGKIEVEGLKDGLKAITQPKKVGTKFPYKLPAGTIWENLIIRFLDDDNISINVKGVNHSTNYKDMGLVGKGNNPNPSEGWTFLRVLSRVNGELTINDPEARNKYKKQKELLGKSLQNYFSIDYDPFYPYKSSSEKNGNSYKIKVTLIPPTDQNRKGIINEDKDNLGVKAYLDEQAPQVYEAPNSEFSH